MFYETALIKKSNFYNLSKNPFKLHYFVYFNLLDQVHYIFEKFTQTKFETFLATFNLFLERRANFHTVLT